MLTGLAALALTCAPNIHPTTLSAVIQHESSNNAFAIGVNPPAKPLRKQPKTLDEAIAVAKKLIAADITFGAGFGQIDTGNWTWLGLDAETVFDPCRNLAAAQTVLSECYARALKSHQATQKALRAALSCYNTGDLHRGVKNGYVAKILAAAGIKVPALEATETQAGEAPTIAPTKPAGTPDGFATPTPDGFSQPTPHKANQTAPAA